MSEHIIVLTEDQEATLSVRSMGQDVGKYLQAKCEGMAEEFRAEYESLIKQQAMEKIKAAAEMPELKADYEALLAKVDAELAKPKVEKEEISDEKIG